MKILTRLGLFEIKLGHDIQQLTEKKNLQQIIITSIYYNIIDYHKYNRLSFVYLLS